MAVTVALRKMHTGVIVPVVWCAVMVRSPFVPAHHLQRSVPAGVAITPTVGRLGSPAQTASGV